MSEPGSTAGADGPLDADEKAVLLRLARAALDQDIAGTSALDRLLEDFRPTPRLERHCGAFVSLHRRPASPGDEGPLRGCFGHMEAERPLWRMVVSMARAAALSDPRFRPVAAEELPHLTLEISVLSPPAPVAGPGDFHPGPDGVQMELRGRRAVFLPQVARETGWSREETLRHLSRKAGLGPDDWRSPDARFWTFQADVFSEPAGP